MEDYRQRRKDKSLKPPDYIPTCGYIETMDRK